MVLSFIYYQKRFIQCLFVFIASASGLQLRIHIHQLQCSSGHKLQGYCSSKGWRAKSRKLPHRSNFMPQVILCTRPFNTELAQLHNFTTPLQHLIIKVRAATKNKRTGRWVFCRKLSNALYLPLVRRHAGHVASLMVPFAGERELEMSLRPHIDTRSSAIENA